MAKLWNQHFVLGIFMSLSCVMAACSSKDTAQVKRVDQGTPPWDYNQVRSVRQAEADKAAGTTDSESGNEAAPGSADCKVMSLAEIAKSKIAGCHVLKEGSDKFCCPK